MSQLIALLFLVSCGLAHAESPDGDLDLEANCPDTIPATDGTCAIRNVNPGELNVIAPMESRKEIDIIMSSTDPVHLVPDNKSFK